MIPIKYSEEEIEFAKEKRKLPRRESYALFVKRFDRSDVSYDNFRSMCKRRGFFTGRSGKFDPGHIPSPKARPKGPNKTSFKPGQRPHNYLPVGTMRVDSDGYHQIKTADPRMWSFTHILKWEEANDPIPDDKILTFIDGDRDNLDMDNLELVTRKQALSINQVVRNTKEPEVRKVQRTLGKLISATHG